ncbi:MAG: TlpA disulfide reductase family protein [Deltaproteobacteria bacterium]|nr:TlpA disulfide reductase family protein [Deltaproteobacteria bacterium]MDZ4224929.1 TlpA disulfide reductase family protein [bacterium]
MKRVILFFLIAGPIVALLAFGLTRNPRELPSAMIGKKAPDFALKNLEGKEVTLESLKGQNLLINFWATWCGPCYQEHAVLKAIQKQHAQENLRLLGVVYQDSVENVKEYLRQEGKPFEVLLDPDNKMGIDYGVGGVPETFFVDAEGFIREKHSGVLTMEYVEFMLNTLK